MLLSKLEEQLLWTDLVKAVPDEHKKFLADMVWVHEEVSPVLFPLILIFSGPSIASD